MTLVSVLFKTKDKLGALIGTFDMDVTIREQHQRSANITAHPVESNSTISDHVFLEPKALTIEGFVSSAPPSYFGSVLEERRADPNSFSPQDLRASRVRSVNAFDQLQTLFDARQPLTVATSMGDYKDMVIRSLSIPVERTIGLRFVAELQQVIIANELSTAVELQTSVEDSAASEQDRGNVQTTTPSQSTENAMTSAALSIAGG